ncbi:GHKL domain protein [Leptospira ryugenii]|uniref:histidine kinase n=1 Tax=Leptospira ryugenii TaxID=1917863 RepID=A0A2P2E167_9LEPT|nr:GHKL domain protein [Leptospira ryugenii]
MKNPAVLFLGTSLVSASFRFGNDINPSLRIRFVRLSIFLSIAASLFNFWGFFHRKILFDPTFEFYVPEQKSSDPFIYASILSVAIVVSLQLATAIITLILKRSKSQNELKSRIDIFLLASLAILCMAFFNIFVDLGYLNNETYLFLMTNTTFISVTAVILNVLNQENFPSNVGFKIMAFNVALIYLVLSVIANILFIGSKRDFQREFDREKDFIKIQIEKGVRYPIIHDTDFVFDLFRNQTIINKTNQNISKIPLLTSRAAHYENYDLVSLFETNEGIFWIGDFIANNIHYSIGLSYLDYRWKIHRFVFSLLLTLSITLVIIFFLYPVLHKRNIVIPLNRLLYGLSEMRKGNLDTRIPITTFDEIGVITKSFNEMIARIQDSTENLETLIQERTEELHQKLEELNKTQSALLVAERMSVLGKIAAGVAHEINNPLAAIKASVSILKQDPILHPPLVASPNSRQAEEIHHLVESGMEHPSEGQVSKIKQKRELASILHDLGFEDSQSLADSCFDLNVRYIPERQKSLLKEEKNRQFFIQALQYKQSKFHLSMIETAIERSSKIVFALKSYSYAGPKENRSVFELNKGIESVLQMYANVWPKDAQIIVDLEPNILLYGYADELVQVWTNLIYNAIQATAKTRGIIKIHSEIKEDTIELNIQDNGEGISPENLPNIFEPFFTTKEFGMGTGLGLPTAKKIIDAHMGHIEVQSVPGDTCFKVILPIYKQI